MDKTTLAEYEKRARRMVVYCWFSYMILYIGKKTLKLCLPDMIATGVCTEAQGGVISSVFLASYAAGQFINGWLGDRIHPRTMMTGGLILSGAMNVFMGLCHSAGLMTLIWGLCGFFCSMLWAPLIRAVSTWTTERVAQACAASLSRPQERRISRPSSGKEGSGRQSGRRTSPRAEDRSRHLPALRGTSGGLLRHPLQRHDQGRPRRLDPHHAHPAVHPGRVRRHGGHDDPAPAQHRRRVRGKMGLR